MLTPIGQTLKTAREKRGLSLLDVSHLTRIPVARLHLLEQDNYAAFGSMTYARSFLRRYSQFLGVDATVILEDLPSGMLGGPRDYRYLTDNHGLWVAPKGERLRQASYTPKGRRRSSPVPAGIFVFVLVLIGTGMWGKYVADDRLAHDAEKEPVIPPIVATQPMPSSVQVTSQLQALKAPLEPQVILKAIPVPEDELPQAAAGNRSQVE